MMAATVARQPAAAASMMARVERLDLLLGYLEEMMHGNGNASPNNNSATTASSLSIHHRGLLASSDDDDSDASTPRGRSKQTCWRRPRPAKEVLEEAQAKGSLVDRIAFLEHRVLKMEEDMEITPADITSHHQPRAMMSSKDDDPSRRSMKKKKKKKKKKGLKSLVKSCVRGNLKTKD